MKWYPYLVVSVLTIIVDKLLRYTIYILMILIFVYINKIINSQLINYISIHIIKNVQSYLVLLCNFCNGNNFLHTCTPHICNISKRHQIVLKRYLELLTSIIRLIIYYACKKTFYIYDWLLAVNNNNHFYEYFLYFTRCRLEFNFIKYNNNMCSSRAYLIIIINVFIYYLFLSRNNCKKYWRA